MLHNVDNSRDKIKVQNSDSIKKTRNKSQESLDSAKPSFAKKSIAVTPKNFKFVGNTRPKTKDEN